MWMGRFKFRVQLNISFTMIIAFIIIALLAMLHLILRDSYRGQESSVLLANNRQIAINIDNRLDYYMSYLRLLSTDKNLVRTMEAETFAKVRQELYSAVTEYMNLNVARLNGIRVYRNGIYGRVDGIGDVRSIFKRFVPGSQVYRNNFLVTGTYLNSRNEKVFSIFHKVFQSNANREYFLEMCVYETELYGFFNRDDSGNHIVVFSGDNLLSMNDRGLFTRLLYRARQDGQLGVSRDMLSSSSKPITISTQETSGIEVVIETDTSYLDRAYGTILRRMALVVAAVLALAFFIVWQISIRLNRRMRQLSEKIGDISEWKLEREIRIRGQDEFSHLAAELDETRRRILALVLQNSESHRLKREAEISALRAQINSHFLFNSLSSIKWLSKRNDHEQLQNAVDQLAVFLRYSLSLKEDLVPLRLELEHLNAYTHLQRLRYGDDVNVHTDIAEELLDCKTLKLLLQPLVENAIYHGRREDGMPLDITIYSAPGEGFYDLIVEDDGNGMSAARIREILVEVPGDAGGYGLRNVIGRLRMCLEGKGELQIESDPGVSTRVIVRQPL